MTKLDTRLPLLLLVISSLVTAQACVSDDIDANNIQDDNAKIRDATDLGVEGDDLGAQLDMSTSPSDSGSPDSGIMDQGTPPDMSVARDMARDQHMSPEEMGQDMSMQDMNAPDLADMTPIDMAPPNACLSMLAANQTFEIHPTGFAGQFYSRSVFDGEGVWITFVMRESASSGTGDVWIARYGCDGRALVAPVKVSEPMPGINEVYPAIAALEGDVYVTWIEDTSSNDLIKMRSFTRDGTFQQSAPVDITPSLGRVPISGLFQELDIAALPQQQAVITASHYAQDASALQVTVQRVDFNGALLGDPMEPQQEKGVEQSRPSIASTKDGAIYVNWSRYKPANTAAGTPEEPYRVVYTRFAPGATEPDVGGPFPAQPGAMVDNQLGRYSKEHTTNSKLFLTFQSDSAGSNDVLVKDGTFGASVTTGFVGNSGYDLRPSVAARPDGRSGAVTWYRADPSPTQLEVHIQRFDLMPNGTFSFGQDLVIQTPEKARAPFGPSITHVSGDVYFISWQDGPSNGTAKVKGRFVQL